MIKVLDYTEFESLLSFDSSSNYFLTVAHGMQVPQGRYECSSTQNENMT